MSPVWPRAAARSFGPIRIVSIPATDRIASRSSSASRVSIWMQHMTSSLAVPMYSPCPAPVLGRPARGDAAQPDRRIAAPGHGPLGVGDGPDLGNDDATRSGVERVHDPDGLVGGHAVEQGHAGGAERDEHLDEVRRRDRTVLAVGDEQVEPGTGHELRDGRIEDRQPRAEQEVAGRETGAEAGHHRRPVGRAHPAQHTARRG